TFEPVAKHDLLWGDVAEADEIDLDVTSARRQTNGLYKGIAPAVGDDLFDMHRRPYRVLEQVSRIKHLQNGVGGEPQPSVGRAGGLRFKRCGSRADTVQGIEHFDPDHCVGMRPPSLQIGSGDPDEAALRVEPQRTLCVENGGMHAITW